MKNYLIVLSGVVLIAASSQAATSLQFSKSPTGATGFANAAGTATNGMLWGIVIDTAGDGFDSGQYDAFNSGASGFMNTGGGASDDYYYFTGVSTATLGAPFFSGGEAGAGGISTANNVPNSANGIAGIDDGDAFAIIWFATSTSADGDAYGMFTNGAFSLTSSALPVDYSAPFVGADPTRSANLTFGGTAAPEPSRTVLAFFGLAMVGLRRRRR